MAPFNRLIMSSYYRSVTLGPIYTLYHFVDISIKVLFLCLFSEIKRGIGRK